MNDKKARHLFCSSACPIFLSVSAEQRPGLELAFPCGIPDDVIVAAYGGEFPPVEDFADAAAPRDGKSHGTEGVKLHALAVQKDVVTDEERLFEEVEGEAGGVTVDMECFDAVMDEVFPEEDIEGEWAADLVD